MLDIENVHIVYKPPSIVKKITSRLNCLGKVPGEVVQQSIFGAWMTTGGLVGTGITVLTLGYQGNRLADLIDKTDLDLKDPLTREYDSIPMYSSKRTISGIYAAFLDVFQPGAKQKVHEELNRLEMGKTRNLAEHLFTKAEEFSKTDNRWKKYLFSRTLYGLAGVAAAVTRVFDGIVGLLAAIASFFALGKSEGLNKFAARNLTVTGIHADVSKAIRGTVNPMQFIEPCDKYFVYDFNSNMSPW